MAALADIEQAMELNENAPVILVTRGFFYLARGDFEQAQADFEAALAATTDDQAEVYLGLGVIAFNQANLPLAADYLQRDHSARIGRRHPAFQAWLEQLEAAIL